MHIVSLCQSPFFGEKPPAPPSLTHTQHTCTHPPSPLKKQQNIDLLSAELVQ